MHWSPTRRFLRLATTPEEDARARTSSRREPAARSHGASICIASGKGGTGKSVVTASLAATCARLGPTLIVDADMGVGNAHILQDVAPERSFVDLVEGRVGVRDLRVQCAPNLDLLSAGSGVSRMASLSNWEMHLVAGGIDEIEREYEHVLVDSAAGISHQTIALAGACDLVLLVTTPDVTALTDAYAFLKVLLARHADAHVAFVVNRTTSPAEAGAVAERFVAVARKFLGREPHCVGALPDDRAVVRCVNARAPVVVREPESPFARAFVSVGARVLEELSTAPARGLGKSLVAGPAPATSF